MRNKILFLFIFFFLAFASSTYAYYCANPLSMLNSCENMTMDEREFTSLCCPDGDYPEGLLYPKSKDDCIANFLSEDIHSLGDKCDIGCCLDMSTLVCFDYISRSNCEGIFSMRFGGACKKESGGNDYYVMGACEQGCCCDKSFSGIDTKISCSEGRFFPEIKDSRICRRQCETLPCIEGCQSQKPLFCRSGNIYYDCTGGDKIIGNANDCGCPPAQECREDGRCIEQKKTPFQKVQETDPCSDVKCGDNSACDNGRCVCDNGFYDDSCRAINTWIDYDASGCVDYNPCNKSKGAGKVFVWGAIILFATLVFILYRKSRSHDREQQQFQR